MRSVCACDVSPPTMEVSVADPRVTQYKTVFGTTTDSPVVASLARVGYACAVLMTLYFAYEGFKVIRNDAPLLVQIAFAGVITLVLGTGLKLLLWRRKRFGFDMLLVTLLGASPALIFNFFGFNHVTGERVIVRDERDAAIVIVRSYDTLARREVGTAEAKFEEARRNTIDAANSSHREELVLLERRVSNANLRVVEESEGAKIEPGATGVVGFGERAVDRTAEKRRADADYVIEKKALDDAHTAKIDGINKAADARMARLKKARELLDELSGYEKQDGGDAALEADALLTSADGIVEDKLAPMQQIVEAESLSDLDEAGRRANKTMAQINSEYTAATGESLNPKPIEVKNGNLFDLSVRGLASGDISAWVSLIIAMLLDWLDTCLVFLMRRREEADEEADVTTNGVGHPVPAAPPAGGVPIAPVAGTPPAAGPAAGTKP